MEKRTIILVVSLFVLIVAGMFTFAYLKNQEVTDVVNEPDSTVAEPTAGNPYGIERVEATRFYIDGVHTLVGEIPMPTPCDLLEATAVVAESMPEQVTVDFTVINTSDMCAQVITPQRFMVAFSASEMASIRATLAGVPIELNISEAAPGQTPEEFELYIKG